MAKHQTPTFKLYICRLVVEEGRKMAQLAYETGVAEGTIRKWVSRYRKELKENKKDQGISTPGDLEKQLRAAEKEMENLREENEILKKFMSGNRDL